MNTKMKTVTWILTAVSVGLMACSGGETAPATSTPTQATAVATGVMTSSGDAEKGSQLYASNCLACHGRDAKGVPGLGKDLVDGEFVGATSDADLVAFIKKGRDPGDPANTTGISMPPKGGNPSLNDQSLADIVAYLRSLS